jgi:L-glyceraldehyde 3-phosphate reductase
MSNEAARTYRGMPFRRLGRSGLDVPRVSLGLWHNFGEAADAETCRSIVAGAFDLGITWFDLANNYGPPPGAAETRFGQLLRELPRDELLLSTKAGYHMWDGPYGSWGSRKHLVASLDQSLRRLGVDYVDVYYHHRPDPVTPLAETLQALDDLRRAGKALYTGISNYDSGQVAEVVAVSAELGISPPVVNQCRHNLLQPGFDLDQRRVAAGIGMGLVAFSPLAQGLLTDRYRDGVPPDSRASRGVEGTGSITTSNVESSAEAVGEHARAAAELGVSLQEYALAWALHGGDSAVVGVSRLEQLQQLCAAAALDLSPVPASG